MKKREYIHLKNQSGFTLIEVLASLTILSIILLGVSNLFVFTNQVAVSNNNRLVAINLGKATLERVKMDPFSYFNHPNANPNITNAGFEYTNGNCEPDNCSELYSIIINDKEYRVILIVSQENEEQRNEKQMQLINVLVKVELPDENINHQVEGYVTYGTK